MTEEQLEWTPGLVLKHLSAAVDANDQRYQERFAAQEKAVRDALAAQKEAVSAALAASEKAVSVAEKNAEKWRENANEWRAAMNDRERSFTSASEFKALKERVDKGEGSGAGMRMMWGWITGAVMAIIAIVSTFWNHKS